MLTISIRQAGSLQSHLVEYIGTICARNYHNALIRVHAVHLDEHLIERLLFLAGAAAKSADARRRATANAQYALTRIRLCLDCGRSRRFRQCRLCMERALSPL